MTEQKIAPQPTDDNGVNVICLDRLRALISYDCRTGKLFWLQSRGRVAAGTEAGSVNGRGYITVQLDGVMFLGHRVAWAMYYGRWPEFQIDHINGDPADNRIDNLRDVKASHNIRNRSYGIGVNRFRNKWQVRACGEYVGNFDCLGLAMKARAEACAEGGYGPNASGTFRSIGELAAKMVKEAGK